MISYDFSTAFTKRENYFNYLRSLKEMIATSAFYSIKEHFPLPLSARPTRVFSPSQRGTADSQGNS